MSDSHNGFIIVLTILLAMVLMIVPMPEVVRTARPEWVLMTLIYWAMALPNRVSIGIAWLTGLLMDVILGSPLGVLAFSYALAIFLIARFHLQLRQYPLWQQALTILTVVFIVNIIDALFSNAKIGWQIILPTVTSTAFWPIMYAVLRKTRRTFQVS